MPRYEVIVGNIGSVYHGESEKDADEMFESYAQASRETGGARCFGEDVTLFVDGEIEREPAGHLREECGDIDIHCDSGIDESGLSNER
jgi:hypothetical protein